MAWTIPTHITLLPPTQVSPGREQQVDEHLRAVATAHAPFEVQLRGTDTFRPVTQTSFVAVEGGSAESAVLAEAVRSGPLKRRLPFPYHPHVTLAAELSDDAHDKAEAELRDFSFDFTVSVMERYELTDHGVWESVAVFELRAPSSAP